MHCIRAVSVSRSSRVVKFGSSICLGVTKLQSISQKMVSMDPLPDPAWLLTGQESGQHVPHSFPAAAPRAQHPVTLATEPHATFHTYLLFYIFLRLVLEPILYFIVYISAVMEVWWLMVVLY